MRGPPAAAGSGKRTSVTPAAPSPDHKAWMPRSCSSYASGTCPAGTKMTGRVKLPYAIRVMAESSSIKICQVAGLGGR